MPRSHGPQRKSRHFLKKNVASRGVSFLLTEYQIGDKVVISVDPREHNTIPHKRYQGRVGIVQRIGRRTVNVGIEMGNKKKLLQTKLNHVRPLIPSGGGEVKED
ncbi:MAG: 50S ribosomal protein L21 [Thermoproteota archaeon]|nr:50S ribosomal protein L21 [Thermoproteota archaeon]